MGYAGGTTSKPTYRAMGDHAESIQIDFDPKVISYEKLLEIFWSSHHPYSQAFSRQYMSGIWTHNEAQKKAAEASKVALEARKGRKVHTEIAALGTFTRAEDYHQKYRLRYSKALLGELVAVYKNDETRFVDSTLAMRLNAYLSGDLSTIKLEKSLESLDLAPALKSRILELVGQEGGAR